MYDEKEIRKRVSRKRQFFFAYLITALAVFSAGILLIVLDFEEPYFFLGIIVSASSLAFIVSLISRASLKALFSKDIKGENVKEHIYEVYVRRGVALRPKQVGMGYGGQPLSHTRMAKAQLRSLVYLKLETGDIKEIRGLRVEHTELYRDGDVLFKYAGTKYPIIVSRKSERQPCPICGSLNLVGDEECLGCDLKIKRENEE